MFERVSKKLDEVRCRTLLGQTARMRGRQIRESSPTLSEKEAEQIASREAVTSLREEGVDATSLSDVTVWSKRFLGAKGAQPRSAPEQDSSDVLKNCDLIMAAAGIRDMLKMTEQEAIEKGETVYYKPEFLRVLYPFIEDPSVATAIPLLHVAPFLRSYFEKCSPGGNLYEMGRFLGER
jgi:hypothetical protein